MKDQDEISPIPSVGPSGRNSPPRTRTPPAPVEEVSGALPSLLLVSSGEAGSRRDDVGGARARLRRNKGWQMVHEQRYGACRRQLLRG